MKGSISQSNDASSVSDSSVTIHIPTSLRRFTSQNAQLQVHADTVIDALQTASQDYPRLKAQLFTPAGDLRRFVNVFLNERDIRHMQQGSTPLNAGDVLTILPAIAGG